MTAPRISTVLCSCSWTGPLPLKTSCPQCKGGPPARMNEIRLLSLRAVLYNANAPLNRATRQWLQHHGLIRSPNGRPPPGVSPGTYKRTHVVTATGEAVLAAALRLEQTRHDVAASVARHADIDERTEP